MKKNLIILTLIISYLQPNVINEIIITGNDITKESVILDLISHVPGDSINIQKAIEDQEALFNSGLFYDAIIYPDSSNYYIFVFEKPKILGTPAADKNEILGWSYGGSLLFNNIKGENKKLKITTLIGATTLFDIQYNNPKLFSLQDSLNINIYNKLYNNDLNNYEIYKQGIKASIALLTKNQKHQLNISNQIEYYKLYLENGMKEKNYSLTNSIGYQFYQPKNSLQIKLSHLLFKKIYNNYIALELENKHYIYFNQNYNGRVLLKNKLKINFNNDIPIHHKDYLISEDYVRGYDIENLSDLPHITNQLLWDKITTFTTQFELPFYSMGSINTKLLFFWDWGYEWNGKWSSNHTNSENLKIRSFGTGMRYDIMWMGYVDICIGLNPYNGNKEIQGIANFTNF